MNFSRLTLSTLLAPALLLAACGGTSSTTTTGSGGAGGSGGSTSTGSEGSTTPSTTGSTPNTTGATSPTGSSSTTTTTTGSSTTTTGSSTTTTGSSTTTTGSSMGTTTSTGSGSGLMNVCLDMADQAIINDKTKDVAGKVGNCAQTKFGMEPATKTCIKTNTMLTDDCVTCFDDAVQCLIKNCLSQCLADQNSAACKTCRATNCDPAFKTCSGINPG